jgi:hypothetical protein
LASDPFDAAQMKARIRSQARRVALTDAQTLEGIMSLRFRRRPKFATGLDPGDRSASLPVRVRGARVTVGPSGIRTAKDLPGGGLSYTATIPAPYHRSRGKPARVGGPLGFLAALSWVIVALFVGGVLLGLLPR